MVEEKAYSLSVRVINFMEIVGCGVIEQKSGKNVVELGDFLDNDRELIDLWGSMACVIAQKFDQSVRLCIVRSEVFKSVIFPLQDVYLGAKVPYAESAWTISARMEPIVRAMESS
ncbi:MAG: hypothetical protein B6244_05405 [Candidatus Cloacimonetes bacterium 4572_55]|nr:MAG: hypothetical protein B6244_05405 [Candidatus Cloacimonetes bacterium 4572_55]